MPARAALFVCICLIAAMVSGSSSPVCDPTSGCKFSVQVGNDSYSWDFSKLCDGVDYEFFTDDGHDFAAMICGTAGAKCLPAGWTNTYQSGVAIQFWGDKPACNSSDPSTLCVDKVTQKPVCCTQDCQVLGVGEPKYSLEDPSDASKGVKATFTGAAPSADDPFWCPLNPSTGEQYPRTVTYHFECNESVEGAVLSSVAQNTTDDCEYHMTFVTNVACVGWGLAPTPTPAPTPAPSPIPECDAGGMCKYSVTVGGKAYSFDFSPLCGKEDYTASDDAGHDYAAMICGTVGATCLPDGWTNPYQNGVAVQFWGVPPACNSSDPSTMKCVDKVAQKPVCCTRNCEVLGVGAPQYSLEDPSDVSKGVKASFTGAAPANDDPWWCPWDPATGQQYPRTVTYHFECDESVEGAVLSSVAQNSTQKCEYHMTFGTKAACPTAL